MRILVIVALSAALMGCAASRHEVAARLGDQFIRQNVDALVHPSARATRHAGLGYFRAGT